MLAAHRALLTAQHSALSALVFGMPRTRLLPVVLLFASIAACGEPATVTMKPLAGSYALAAVNNTPVPTADSLNGVLRTFRSGTLTITDSEYVYTVCVDSAGISTKICGADRAAISDSGLVWWSPGGASFVGTTSHISRALIVNRNRDSLIFNANDFATARFTFVR
jgi:hypothetical protein